MGVKRYASSTARKGFGNGKKAWNVLEKTYSAGNNATRKMLYDGLNSTTL